MMRTLSLALAATVVVGFSAAPQVASAAPDGSYRSSCRDWRTDGSILTATCSAGYGWRQSSIDYLRCRGDIANDRGRLVCRNEWSDRRDWGDGDHRGDGDRRGDDGDWRGGGDGRGDGDWRGGDRGGDWRGGGSLQLFSQRGFYGRAFDVSRDAYNLSDTGFNDRAQSVRIYGGGVWQLCEDSGFRGRCVTLSRSIEDLGRMGMDGRVSSVRRVR
jgi:hypothetical protein